MIDPRDGPDTVAAEPLRGRSGALVTFFDWGEFARSGTSARRSRCRWMAGARPCIDADP